MLKLEPNKYYHIYNRGNNKERLFYSPNNHEYFLSKFNHHCFHVFDTYSYCLMSNHFHFLVSVRSIAEQTRLFADSNLRSKVLRSPSRHLSNFFNSYTQSINKERNRTGSLFQRPFKRKEVDSDDYFRKLIVYIHQNPVHHKFTKSFKDYPYSSYSHFLNFDEDSFLNREKVLDLFGGLVNFEAAHSENIFDVGVF